MNPVLNATKNYKIKENTYKIQKNVSLQLKASDITQKTYTHSRKKKIYITCGVFLFTCRNINNRPIRRIIMVHETMQPDKS